MNPITGPASHADAKVFQTRLSGWMDAAYPDFNFHQLVIHLTKWACETELLLASLIPVTKDPRDRITVRVQWLAAVYHRSPEDRKRLTTEADRYCREKTSEAAEDAEILRTEGGHDT